MYGEREIEREKGGKFHNLGKDQHYKEMEMDLDPLKDRKKEKLGGGQGYSHILATKATNRL